MRIKVLRVIDCFYDKNRLNTVDCYIIISERILFDAYNILLLFLYSDYTECCYVLFWYI